MKKIGIKTYLAAWTIYIIFAFATFPQLTITVMLFSIPLTMLGGWIFLYRGALITTAITIPVHFLLLTTYSNDPEIIQESFNPFGIISQLIFSYGTALLRSLQLEYKRLNESLEELVLERTEDLEKLTQYLIDAQQLESRELNASLLKQPYNELKSMLATSQLLKLRLEELDHPRISDAEEISHVISSCIKQLRTMDENTLNLMPHGEDLQSSLSSLKKQSEQLYDVQFEIDDHPAWASIEDGKVRFLSEIIFEAVSNALRHAEPKRIKIGIQQDPLTTTVLIENDGRPFSSTTREGMGLPLMRFRASKIGAKLSIAPSHTLSTCVTCKFASNK
ncbi:sensor histidine kinase [Pontiella agarivorans]|uniref:histidine kinase n=1 Tax=Pontiella agarivorans TaxID=3038953 RepID=A0ABU5MT34_9BACT|nr:ATP-binding protein [Pontiella agarivorans]MDZ8117366.1 hypothetical protein [Pontiella agarivorans]